MDELTYNKIQETLSSIENQLREVGRDVGHQPIEKEKAFGVIFLKGDNKGCITQILSTPTIVAKMILQCINNHPEVAQEIKRIQAITKLERLANLVKNMFPDDDNEDNKDEEEEKCFDIVVTDANGNGPKLARYIAKNFDFSLKEAADMVRSIPCTIATNLPKEMAMIIQKTIEGLGCYVTIMPIKTKMV